MEQLHATLLANVCERGRGKKEAQVCSCTTGYLGIGNHTLRRGQCCSSFEVDFARCPSRNTLPQTETAGAFQVSQEHRRIGSVSLQPPSFVPKALILVDFRPVDEKALSRFLFRALQRVQVGFPQNMGEREVWAGRTAPTFWEGGVVGGFPPPSLLFF